jgi:hypothetical protein
MKSVVQGFSILVISLFFLTIFGWMSVEISKNTRSFGLLDEPVKWMTSFPNLFKQSVKEVQTLPETFIETAKAFNSINNLGSSILVLTTFSDKNDTRTIALMDLKTDETLHSWSVPNPYSPTDRILNPYLLPNRDLIYSFDGKGLQRIDSAGNVIWKQDAIEAHHAINVDADTNIWVCSFDKSNLNIGGYTVDGHKRVFKDNFISKIDIHTGELLFHKSMGELLFENNLSNYIMKSMNMDDPLHMNDVQPALETTAFYQKGDVFISLKNPSIILHYRPETNELIKLLEGPFISQHDVDFYGDHSLMIFNNNVYEGLSFDEFDSPDIQPGKYYGDFTSNIVVYNFETKSFSVIGDSIFRANQIFTYSEGLVEFIRPDMYFVEEQNSGELWVIKEDEVVYKNVLKSQYPGYHHLPNWTRIIKK